VNIAIIPARGGSKRIPRKNIKIFAGRPMLAYAITAAKQSGLFEHVVVSTEDEEIKEIALEWGAETPFVRPLDLADDYTPTVPVVAHGIRACQELGWVISTACCIYPAVPFLKHQDLLGAINLWKSSAVNYCFPITEYSSPPQRAMQREHDGRVTPMYPQHELSRTQDLRPAFYDAGQFYWGRADEWLKNPKVHSSGLGYVIPNWRVIDIDTPRDWLLAERLYKIFSETEDST